MVQKLLYCKSWSNFYTYSSFIFQRNTKLKFDKIITFTLKEIISLNESFTHYDIIQTLEQKSNDGLISGKLLKVHTCFFQFSRPINLNKILNPALVLTRSIFFSYPMERSYLRNLFLVTFSNWIVKERIIFSPPYMNFPKLMRVTIFIWNFKPSYNKKNSTWRFFSII